MCTFYRPRGAACKALGAPAASTIGAVAFAPPLIVTGMARSGTSAATRLLQSAGLHVGDELIPANDDNQVGRAWWRVRDRVMRRRG